MTDVALSPLSGRQDHVGACATEPFFDALFRTHAHRVRALAERRLPGRGLADDVVQETFLRAYRFAGTFDERRPAWPWLRTIACNVCADLMRPKSASEQPCADVRDGDGIDRRDPIDAVLASERSAVVAAALAAVSPRQRRVLLLRDADGWENDDVAALEATTLEAVKSALKRGRRVFKDAYVTLASERGLLSLLPVPGLAAFRRSWLGRAIGATSSAGRVSFGLIPMVAAPVVLGALAVGAALVHLPTALSGEVPVVATHSVAGDVGSDPAPPAAPAAPPAAGAAAPRPRAAEHRVDATVEEVPVAMTAETSINPDDRASLDANLATALADVPEARTTFTAVVPCDRSEFRRQLCAAVVEAAQSQ